MENERITKCDIVYTATNIKNELDSFTISQAFNKLQRYECLGTVEKFKALKEKSTEKKAIGLKLYNEANCPNCGYTIADDEFYLLSDYTHYCPDCGQAVKDIDWQ